MEEPSVNGRIILQWIFKKLDRSFDWLNLVMGNFLTWWELLSFQEGLGPMKISSWISII
jgi:hypothetical protein